MRWGPCPTPLVYLSLFPALVPWARSSFRLETQAGEWLTSSHPSIHPSIHTPTEPLRCGGVARWASGSIPLQARSQFIHYASGFAVRNIGRKWVCW